MLLTWSDEPGLMVKLKKKSYRKKPQPTEQNGLNNSKYPSQGLTLCWHAIRIGLTPSMHHKDNRLIIWTIYLLMSFKIVEKWWYMILLCMCWYCFLLLQIPRGSTLRWCGRNRAVKCSTRRLSSPLTCCFVSSYSASSSEGFKTVVSLSGVHFSEAYTMTKLFFP